MQEFGDRLRASRIKNADKRDFIPDGALDAAITDLDVKLCVKELQIPSYYQSESIAMIQNGGRKVFAILATLNRGQGCGELIVNFFGIDGLVKNSDIDSRLPFEVIDLEPIIGQEIAPEFYERQWEFISPFFREDRSHRILHEDTIMPFIDKGRKKLADGGFGVVYRETLSTEHHGLVNRYGSDGKVRIVRKEITPLNTSIGEAVPDTKFRMEEQILLLLRELQHPNIVRLLASYSIRTSCEILEEESLGQQLEYQDVHNLLFPLADETLSKLFEDGRQDILHRYFPSDDALYQQLWGLSSALESLHNYFSSENDLRLIGCHFDLAPRNILIHKSRLLLADFGLSRLRHQESGSTTPFKAGKDDYLAPECEPVEDQRFTKGFYGRPSDIWSFGCILAEIVTFMHEGAVGIQSFKKMRKDHPVPGWNSYQFHLGGKVSTKVEKWLDNLEAGVSTTQKSILELVRLTLNVDPKQRPQASSITTELFLIAQKYIFDSAMSEFDVLVSKNPVLELRLERERFAVWGSVSKLTAHSVSLFNDLDAKSEDENRYEHRYWLSGLKIHFFALGRLLISIREEVDFLSQTLKTDLIQRPFGAQLNELIENIWMIAPSSVRQAMESMLEDRITRMDEFILEKLRDDLPNDTSLRQRLGKLAAIKYMICKIESNTIDEGQSNHQRLLLHTSQVHIDGKHIGAHSLCSVSNDVGSNVPALCEWIEYDMHWVDQDEGELYNRVGKIAELFNLGFPLGFQVLRCIGYFHQPTKHSIGLAFAFPDSNQTTPPISLRKFLQRLSSRPLLGVLFTLAKHFVQSVLYFHKTGWLHKNISSYNVVFFNLELPSSQTQRGLEILPQHSSQSSIQQVIIEPASRSRHKLFKKTTQLLHSKNSLKSLATKASPKETRDQISQHSLTSLGPSTVTLEREISGEASDGTWILEALPTPYLIGFNHSRPNNVNAFTEGPPRVPGEQDYQHPQYGTTHSKQRFQPGHEYYSVGLVLLEIGLWKPLSAIIGGNIEDYSLADQQKFWREKAVPLLGQSAGAIYRDAVSVCLSNELLDVPDPQKTFELKVVKPISSCRA